MDRIQFEQSGAIDFAARVNDALSKDEKNVVRFDSDEALTSALNDIAATLDFDMLGDGVFVIGSVAKEFRKAVKQLMKVDIDTEKDSLTWQVFKVGQDYFDDPSKKKLAKKKPDIYAYSKVETETKDAAYSIWQFFKNDTTDTEAVADLVVIRGDQTNPAECVAQLFSKLIADDRMPVENKTGTCKYVYTGSIDAVKVDGADGNAPFYLAGFKITQTAVPV